MNEIEKSVKITKTGNELPGITGNVLPVVIVSPPVHKSLPKAKRASDSKRKPKYFWDPGLVAEYMAQHKCTKALPKELYAENLGMCLKSSCKEMSDLKISAKIRNVLGVKSLRTQ